MEFSEAPPGDPCTLSEWHSGIWRIWIYAYAFGQFRFQFGYQREGDRYPSLIMPNCCTYKTENAEMIVNLTMSVLEDIPEDSSHKLVAIAINGMFHGLIGDQWKERSWPRVRLDEVLEGKPLRM